NACRAKEIQKNHRRIRISDHYSDRRRLWRSKMANGPATLLNCVRKLVVAQALRKSCDRDLLDAFIERQDEAAFAALVERYGSMVFGVCRRVLRNTHDAEDACQAAFLVLARKAGVIRKKDSLGSWLHGVAFRVASDLKKRHTCCPAGVGIDDVP